MWRWRAKTEESIKMECKREYSEGEEEHRRKWHHGSWGEKTGGEMVNSLTSCRGKGRRGLRREGGHWVSLTLAAVMEVTSGICMDLFIYWFFLIDVALVYNIKCYTTSTSVYDSVHTTKSQVPIHHTFEPFHPFCPPPIPFVTANLFSVSIWFCFALFLNSTLEWNYIVFIFILPTYFT